MELTGLPFTTTRCTPARWFNTASGGLRLLTKFSAITCAADNGAINAWYSNDGQWRAHRMRYHVTEDECTCATKKDLREWLAAALVAIK